MQQRNPHEYEDQRGFGQNGDHDRATGADPAVRASGIEAGERDHERAQCENEPAAENIAHVRERQRKFVNTRMRIGTVRVVVKATIGAAQ